MSDFDYTTIKKNPLSTFKLMNIKTQIEFLKRYPLNHKWCFTHPVMA